MSYITDDKRLQCHGIIHAASLAAGAAASPLAQIPGSDCAVIVPIQTAMAVALSKVFGLSVCDGAAKAAVATAGATYAGRFASQVLIGWLPLIGNAVNAATAAAITEAVGWIVAEEFAQQAQQYYY